MNTRVKAEIRKAVAVAGMMLASMSTGCSIEHPRVIESTSSTPLGYRVSFRLPEEIWGPSDQTLVMALYMTSEYQAYAWYRFIWCHQVIVLKPDASGKYRIPNYKAMVQTILMPIPLVESQRSPMVWVFGSDGRFGIYHHEKLASNMQWYSFQNASRVYRKHGELVPSVPVKTSSTHEGEIALGCLITALLESHDPQRLCTPSDKPARSGMLLEHVVWISNFLESHSDRYAETTRQLWRRLRDHHNVSAISRQNEYWGWHALEWIYRDGRIPTDADLIHVLPEREQRLVRGRYDPSSHPYDQREENRRLIEEFMRDHQPGEVHPTRN